MRNFSLYLFDFDYTLVDSSEGIVKCFNHAFNQINLPELDAHIIQNTIGDTLENSFFVLTGIKNTNDFEIFKKHFMDYSYKYMHDNVILYEDTINTLSKLKADNKKIGIISSKDRFTIEKIAKKFNFYHYIDIIVGEDDTMLKKPFPNQIFLALDRLNIKCEDTIYIGDSLIDAQTAYNAKIPFLAQAPIPPK